MTIKIINTPGSVIQFCDDIVALADSQSAALSFPPRAAYEGAIFRNNMHVALLREKGKDVFAGHIWLGGRWPAKTVVQVAVRDKYQRKGIGGKLLQDAISHAKNDGFRTISAKVGKDLPANRFWQKQGFVLVETVQGKSTHPDCHIREKQLVPHTLISSANLPHASGAVLRRAIESVKTELSVIPDTNIFINAYKGDKEAIAIFERKNISIMRTSATTRELRKHRGDGGALRFALKIAESKASGDGAVVEELRKIIFAAKHLMKEQDRSDLESLAIAIAAGVSLFVTEDKEILQKRSEIYEKFSLDISHPGVLRDEMLFGEGAGK